MYEFWYDCVKPKYKNKTKLCYMDTGNFIVYIKIENIYTDMTKDVEARFDTSNYDRPLPNGKNKKVIGFMKNELGEKIMKKFASFRTKTYKYLTDNGNKIYI